MRAEGNVGGEQRGGGEVHCGIGTGIGVWILIVDNAHLGEPRTAARTGDTPSRNFGAERSSGQSLKLKVRINDEIIF